MNSILTVSITVHLPAGYNQLKQIQEHTDTRLFKTSTTALNPGAVLILSLSPSSTIPNSFPVSWMRREMSDVNVNEDPRAGLIDVAENRERGLVGALVAWAFITYHQPIFRADHLKGRRTHKSSKPMSIGQFSNIFHYPHHSRLSYHQRYSSPTLKIVDKPAEFVLIN